MKKILAVLLFSGFLCSQVKAEILPLIDRLDLQLGPGLAVVDTKPFLVEVVLLGTAKVYERWNLEARIGGLLDDERRALVLGLSRSFNDFIVRTDNEEQKTLLPSIGFWVAGDVVSSEIEGEEGKNKIDFLWGINAVLAEF